MAKTSNQTPGIKIIGVGGAGVSIIEPLARENHRAFECVAIHTEAQVLEHSSAAKKVQLGRNTNRGLGSGGNPMVGQNAANESLEEMREAIQSPLVIVCAGLGGGTGTGAASVVAKTAAESGALVLGLVTLPFTAEGVKRQDQAQAGLEKLGHYCAAVMCFENDRMAELAPFTVPVKTTFNEASKIMGQVVLAVVRMLGLPSVMRVGLDELAQAFKDMETRCHFGHGVGEGADRARDAVDAVLQSKLLDRENLLSCKGNVLVYVTGDHSLSLLEVQTVLRLLSSHIDDESQILLGVGMDDTSDELAVTIFVGTAKEQIEKEEEKREILQFERRGEGLEGEALQELLAGEAGEKLIKRDGKKAMVETVTQGELPLESNVRGRFKDLEPTMEGGEDLDIPTFIRMRIRLR